MGWRISGNGEKRHGIYVLAIMLWCRNCNAHELHYKKAVRWTPGKEFGYGTKWRVESYLRVRTAVAAHYGSPKGRGECRRI